MKVVKALEFAFNKHHGQFRRGSGLPYISHPIIVSEIIRQHKGDSKNITDLVCAAILHDVLEDTDATIQEVVSEFGDMVGSLVIELTSNPDVIKEMGDKNEYLIWKMQKMTSYALVIKLADRLSNIIDGPTDKYVVNTVAMISRLEAVLHLTPTEKSLVKEIKIACERHLDN